LDRGCLRAQHGERFRTGLLIGQNRGAAGPAKEGAHGSTLARPMLERLRDSVATGEVDRVYVHAPARSSWPANRWSMPCPLSTFPLPATRRATSALPSLVGDRVVKLNRLFTPA